MTALDEAIAKADEALTGRFPYNDASNRERDLARALRAVAEALNEFRSDAKCNDWSLAQAADMFRAAIERRLKEGK